MFFDLTDHGKVVKCKISPPSIPLDNQSNVALGIWEEHCVECGAPACYATCSKFSKTISGKCRRFMDGICQAEFDDGTRGYAIHFLPWGKLEMPATGKIVSRRWLQIVVVIDYAFIPLVRILSRLLPFCPWNRNPIAIYRSIRARLLKLVPGVSGRPNRWLIRCHSLSTIDLRCSIVNGSGEEMFSVMLHLVPGWNSVSYDLPSMDASHAFRIFSIDGTEGPVIFETLELANVPSSGLEQQSASGKSLILPAKYVKCVVWDLDNTLWDGILVEDGPEGVKLREHVLDVIKDLDKRGIVSSICSKNDYATAWAHLCKLGIEKYFVYPSINWSAKSENIKAIAKSMNIGLDTIAFVDDSAHERGEVLEKLPMIRVFSDDDVQGMTEEECFNVPVSSESASRRQTYLDEMRRTKHEIGFEGSHVEFIRDCEIIISCRPVIGEEVVRRCWELVNRTNQLTLAAHRYGESEFKAMLDNSSMETYAIRCCDKYGDYGIVGFVAFSCHETDTFINEFVMSCRVAKKFCEQSVLMFLAAQLKKRGMRQISTTIVATGRNGALIDAFEAMPFRKTITADDGKNLKSIEYVLNLNEIDFTDLSLFTNKVEIADWDSANG